MKPLVLQAVFYLTVWAVADPDTMRLPRLPAHWPPALRALWAVSLIGLMLLM